MVALSLFGAGRQTTPAGAGLVSRPERTLSPAQAAVERGLEFLEADAAKWKAEKQCSTCHHGVMTAWAYSEAKARGYTVSPDALNDTSAWTKDRLLANIDKPRDPRPGWSMVSTPALYLALMARSVPNQPVISADELRRIGGHLLRHQEETGAWSWASAPAKNRPPPVFESDEVATTLGIIALGDPAENPADEIRIRDSLKLASAWLASSPPEDTTQAAALRLVAKVRAKRPARDIRADVDALLKRRNSDGAWGQIAGRDSDAYATGQTLYALGLAGVKASRKEIKQAVEFLVSTQKADGSWPMAPRSHADATPASNAVPIVYFGSAWATIGLARSAPR